MADPLSLLISTSLMSAFGPATVGSVGVGGAIGLGGMTVGQAAVISQFVTAGLFLGGSIALQMAMAPHQRRASALKETTAINAAPRHVIYGRAMLGSNVIFGGANANRLYRLCVHCQGPIEGIEAYYLSGREVTVEDDTVVSSLPYYSRLTPAFHWAQISTYLGGDAGMNLAGLADVFPQVWKTTSKGKGMAMSLLAFNSPGIADIATHTKIYPNGKPTLQVVARGRKIYDPTGGAAWSDNAARVLYAHLIADPVRYGGWGFTATDFDLAELAVTIQKCDAAVTIKGGGTEPRSRLWVDVDLSRARSEVLADMLLSSGLQIVPLTSGKLAIRLIDDDPAATVTLTDERAITAWTWKGGPEGAERPNRATLSYLSEKRKFDLGDLDLSKTAWAKATDEIDATGERTEDIVLSYCPSKSQAARIARRIFALRRAPTGMITANLGGLAAMGHANGNVILDELGTVPVTLRPTRLEKDMATVTIPFAETPNLPAFGPYRDEPDDVVEMPPVESLSTPPRLISNGAQFVAQGWTLTIPAGDADASDDAEALHYQIRTRFTSEALLSGQVSATEIETVARAGPPEYGGWFGLSMAMSTAGSGIGWGYGDGDFTEDYEIRARAGTANEVTEWCDTFDLDAGTIDATAPDAPTTTSDLLGFRVHSTSLNGARVRVSRLNAGTGFWQVLGNNDIAPWAPFLMTVETGRSYRFQIFNSSGVGSSILTVTA